MSDEQRKDEEVEGHVHKHPEVEAHVKKFGATEEPSDELDDEVEAHVRRLPIHKID